MDVDIDSGGVDFEKKKGYGVSAFGDEGVVGFEYRIAERTAFDGTAVDDGDEFLAGGAAEPGPAEESVEAEVAVLYDFDLTQLGSDGGAPYFDNTVA